MTSGPDSSLIWALDVLKELKSMINLYFSDEEPEVLGLSMFPRHASRAGKPDHIIALLETFSGSLLFYGRNWGFLI